MAEAEQDEPLAPAEPDPLHSGVDSVAEELGHLHQQVTQPFAIRPKLVSQRFVS
jgi:hypothetical protein